MIARSSARERLFAALFVGAAVLGLGLWLAPVARAEDGKASTPKTASQVKTDSHDHSAHEHGHDDHGHDAHQAGHSHDAHESGHGHDAHGPKLHGKTPLPFPGFISDPKVTSMFRGTEFLAVSPQLFVWTLLVFIPLYLFLSQFIWKPVLHSLESREGKIHDSLTAAKRMRDEARALLEHQDLILAHAHDEVKKIMEKARDEAAKDSETILSKAKGEAAEAQAKAEAEIAAARSEAMNEVRLAASKLASDVLVRTTGKQMSASELEPIVKEVG